MSGARDELLFEPRPQVRTRWVPEEMVEQARADATAARDAAWATVLPDVLAQHQFLRPGAFWVCSCGQKLGWLERVPAEHVWYQHIVDQCRQRLAEQDARE